MLICMQSTSVRIDVATHEELKRLAAELNTTVGNTVSLAVRALRQDRVGDGPHHTAARGRNGLARCRPRVTSSISSSVHPKAGKLALVTPPSS